MSDRQLPNFAAQDLRHRSFRRQRLNGADFSGADIRGCNFSGAELIGAKFIRVKAGQTKRQRFLWLGVAAISLLVVGHAIYRLVFAALGQTPADQAWGFVIALYVSLGIAGAASGLRLCLPWTQQIAKSISGIASAALVGFFYVGSATGNQSEWAILGAVLSGLLMGTVKLWRPTAAIAISVAGSVAAYGFAFLIGATALAFLSTHHFGGGLLLGSLCILFLWLTINSLTIAVDEIRHSSGTLFRAANLTDANFTEASLRHTDFGDAVGKDMEQQNKNRRA